MEKLSYCLGDVKTNPHCKDRIFQTENRADDRKIVNIDMLKRIFKFKIADLLNPS